MLLVAIKNLLNQAQSQKKKISKKFKSVNSSSVMVLRVANFPVE